MKLIDIPQRYTRRLYAEAIDDMVDKLSKLDSVHSVYQIGSISHPGISDIDMFVVFNDEASCQLDVRHAFGADTYLFTHKLYGCSVSHWEKLQDYTFFHNYRILFGKGFSELSSSLIEANISRLKRQIALEFLVKNYFTLTIQKRYKTIKARSFLLEGKALIYDMEFLDISDGPLWDLINDIINLRENWFELQDSREILVRYFLQLPDLIRDLLTKEFDKQPLFIDTTEDIQLASNVHLFNSSIVGIESSGFTPPFFGLLKERKRFNALHRINKFEITLPYERPLLGDVNQLRLDFLSEMKSYNSRYLPHFLIPATSLKIS
jgi:hypothetical protein